MLQGPAQRTARTRAPQLARSLGWFARSSSGPAPPPPPAPPAEETHAAPEEHDLVIVGGGPAGLTLAAALASDEHLAQTHSITLIEGGPLAPVRTWEPGPGEYSNRVSSITADNAALLARAGVWQHLDLARTRPLDELQVWDGLSDARIEFQAPFLPAAAASPTDTGDAWDAAFASALRPRRAQLSTMVENLNLQRAALRRIDQCVREKGARVEILDAKRVEGIERGDGGWPVVSVRGKDEVGAGRKLRARLLIGADGANSPVKSFSKIDTFGWAYDRHGIVATLAVDPLIPGEGMSTGWQRFLPEGPIAFLPLSDSHASLVWSTTPAYAALIKSLPLDVLPHLVTAAFTLPYGQLRSFLSSLLPPRPVPGAPGPPSPVFDAPALIAQLQGALLTHSQATYDPSSPAAPLPPSVSAVQAGSVASFPLRLSHTSSYLGLPSPTPSSGIAQDARTALVGDAAHTVHPLAGQGLNLGLADAFALASLLSTRAAQGADIGAFLSLKEYPRRRYLANHAVLSACDHLASLYSRTDRPSVWARSAGVEVLNELEPLKALMMGRAGSGGGAGARSAGPWGAVASVMESVGKARDLVGMVGGAVVGQVGRRAAEFIVKGR
ncbi:Putative ubiquinone biosynthesis monooxygenase [Rhodotorula kratochvilovae]